MDKIVFDGNFKDSDFQELQLKEQGVRRHITVSTNLLPCKLDDENKLIFMYAVYFAHKEPSSIRTDAVNDLINRKQLLVPSPEDEETLTLAYDGNYLFSSAKLKYEVSTYSIKSEEKILQIRIMYRSKRKLKRCDLLLKYLIDRVPPLIGCIPVHRKFVDPSTRRNVPGSDLEVYGAYRVRLSQADLPPTFLIDVTASLQRSRTIADILNALGGETDAIIHHWSTLFFGKFVTNFNKNHIVKIQDIFFEEMEWILIVQGLGFNKEVSTVRASDYHLVVTANGDPVKHTESQTVLKYSAISANLRYLCILNFLHRVNGNKAISGSFRQWGITFGTAPVCVNATIIPVPKVTFGANQVNSGHPLFWSTKTGIPMKFFKVVECCKWQFYALREHMDLGKKLVTSLTSAASTYGFRLPRVNVICVQPLRRLDSGKCRFTKAMMANLSHDVEFVMVLLPAASDGKAYTNLYQRIKQLCVSNRSLISQMVRVETLKSRSRDDRTWLAFVGSLLNGINCKLGGAPWKVNIPWVESNVMVVGMDVWHDTTRKNAGSVGALCCSLSNDLTEIYSTAMFHGWREEIFPKLKPNFHMALKAYRNRNGKLPERILVYRDGVNCRHYTEVMDVEVKQMLEVISEIYEAGEPKFTVVIVHKRIYERFFALKDNSTIVENVPPGTIIDNTVVRKSGCNFFLTSKIRQKGTTVPTHYQVLCDNSGLPPQTLQEITNALCYSYFNWPGTFYIPCVVQYAHKLASSVATTRILPPSELRSKLHFL